jgi:hypothetical protein
MSAPRWWNHAATSCSLLERIDLLMSFQAYGAASTTSPSYTSARVRRTTITKGWVFEPDGTVRSLDLCMALAGGSSANGTTIEVTQCDGGPAQRFSLNRSSDLVNVAADKCVDVKDQQTTDGARLQLWQCSGTSNQKWHTA